MPKSKNKTVKRLIGKKKYKHPADEYRKRLRKKEIKRNKEQREERRNNAILIRNEESLRMEITKLDSLEKKSTIDPHLISKNKKLKIALQNLLNAKKKRTDLKNSIKVKGLQKIVNLRVGSNVGNKNNEDNATSIKVENRNEEINVEIESKKIETYKRTPEQTSSDICCKNKLLGDTIYQLNSLDGDGAPFVPPGISIIGKIYNPPGKLSVSVNMNKNDDGNKSNNTVIPRLSKKRIPEINDCNKQKTIQSAVVELIPNRLALQAGKNGNDRRDFEKRLLDPLNPLGSSNFREHKIGAKTKIVSRSPLSNISKHIGPKITDLVDSEKSKYKYNDNVSCIVDKILTKKKIDTEIITMVPSSVLVKRKPKRKRLEAGIKLDLAPTIRRGKNKKENFGYEKFLKEIQKLETRKK